MKKYFVLTAILWNFFNHAQAQALPGFVLACSSGGGQPLYRVASDGKDIYFASTLNEANLNGARKSLSVDITEREIRWRQVSGSDLSGKGEQAVIYRDTLGLRVGNWSFSCERINDNQIFNELKNRFNTARDKERDERRQYDNRPNKL